MKFQIYFWLFSQEMDDLSDILIYKSDAEA
jgi:hypothetical protein